MSRDPAVVGLRRRLGALLYDAIAAFAVLYFAAFAPVVVSGDALAPGNPLFTLYLLLVLFGYFGVSWTHGRTLGMQAWKIAIVNDDGGRPDWRAAARRFAAAAVSLALGGAGYFVALTDPARRAWPDRWSRTRLVRQDALTARGSS
ncbi:MAG: RDD family protein [Gammaproteobacteria bacterium]